MNDPDSVMSYFNNSCSSFDSIYNDDNNYFTKFVNRIFRKSMDLRFSKVISEVAPYEDQTVLDVGCGAGRYCLALSCLGVDMAYGIDFAESMIEMADTKASAINMVNRCQFKRTNFMDIDTITSYDYVFAMGVMDYIENPLPFIEKMVCTANKKVMISFPQNSGFIQWCRAINFRYIKKCPVYFYSLAEIVSFVTSLGISNFTVEKLAMDYFLLINIPK